MGNFADIKELLKDRNLHLYLAKIVRIHLAEDRSYLKVTASVFPEEREIIATMTWENVGPECGDFEFPSPGDMVIIGNSEGDDDQAYVLKRLTSREDKIPAIAASGKVQKARAGNKFWNISDTRINLSRSETEPTENMVLGQVFKLFAQNMLEVCKSFSQNTADHKHIGNLGYLTAVPDNLAAFTTRKTEYNNLKTSPINDGAILSDLGFIEK